MSSKVERKLAAIMFTDIVGYTAQMSKDETKALNLLDTQKQILTPIIKEFNGTLHKEMGDGLLFTFPTVTEAVKCGIKIQGQTKDSDDLNLRIGIHEGEITLKDGDVLGDDVNVASRIEPFSAVGGIAISGKVQQNISSLTEFETKYIGKPKLKGVAQKVEVYCITSHGLPQTDLSKVSAKLEVEEVKPQFNIFALTGGILTVIGIAFWIAVGVFDVSFAAKIEVPSVGILMMDNLGEEDEEFWSSGMTADLITKVAGAGLIRVAPIKDVRNIDSNLSIEEIAKKLRVKYILTHSFLIKNDGFDLWYKLENTENGVALFSNKISEPMNMTTQMVGKLANDIVSSLDVKTIQNIMKPSTTNPEAYEFYLRGKHKYEKRENIVDTEIVRGLLDKAIELDDNLIVAKVQLGKTYAEMGDYDRAMVIFTSALIQAEEIGDKRGMGESLNSIGVVHINRGDYDKALDYYGRSLGIFEEIGDKRGMGYSLGNIGNVHHNKGDLDIALGYYKRTFSIMKELGNKYGMGVGLKNIGNLHNYKGEYDTALDYLGKSLSIDEEIGDKRGIGYTLYSIGNVHLTRGKQDTALDYYERSLAIREELADKVGMGVTLTNMGGVYHNKGDYDKALDYFGRSLAINEELGNKHLMAYSLNSIGDTNLDKGDYDKALVYYVRSLAVREELDDKVGVGKSLNSIGDVHHNKGDYEKALDYFKRSLAIFEKVGATPWMGISLGNIGSVYADKGDYDRALDYLGRSLVIDEGLGNKHWVGNRLGNIGNVYFDKGDDKKAEEYLEKSLAIQKEIGLETIELPTMTNLYLTYKHLAKDYDVKEIHSLIKDAEDIEFEVNFRLYELLDDKSYLETAYNQVQDKASTMDDKAKFLSYPIPKAIVEEYNRVFK